jgi:hypothetical protein
MEDGLKQAIADFDLFLSGRRAPALVGHSLATVVEQDVRVVAGAVARWAYNEPASGDRLATLLQARNKVFDVFFYRVVRFQAIYDFFPPFERALVRAVAREDQQRLAALLERYPWREIRPLGSFRDPQEFALEGREAARVSQDEFNDDLYRNATHQILSADRRYKFDDEEEKRQVGAYQSRIAEVFDDFVDLLPDAALKREIQLANAADRDAVYTNQPRFQIDGYLCHLADLAIALHNDDFFEHSVKVFAILDELADANHVRVLNIHKFQEKTELFNLVKMAEYGASKTGSFLLRDVLRAFVRWQPDKLLQLLVTSEDRRERKLTLAMLEAYGRDAYRLVVDQLASTNASTPWYYVRNLVYLLGRMTTNDRELETRAVSLVAEQIAPGRTRQVNQQAIQTLGAIATDQAAHALVTKLAEFETLYARDREAKDAASRIVSALIATETDEALETAFAFCERHELLEQHRDQFNKVDMPDRLRTEVVARVRREMRKLRFSFSILGDALTTREILEAVGHSGQPDVDALCAEIVAKFPARSELAAAARRIQQIPPPPPLLANDRTLHRLLTSRDLLQIFCHVHEVGASGRLDVETRDGATGAIEYADGDVCSAIVPRYFIQSDNAFEWIALVDSRDLVRLTHVSAPGAKFRPTKTLSTRELLREAIFQRGGVEQLLEGFLHPESRYQRCEVLEYYTQFRNTDRPALYRAVWEAIDGESDIRAIQSKTQLSRYDVCKALFYLVKRQMIDVVDRTRDEAQTISLDEALSSIAHAVKQIEARPVVYQNYYAAAEACAFLRRKLDDEALKSAARGLRNFFLDAYLAHSVFVAKHIEICSMTLNLMSRYLRSRADADRRELLDFIAFSFNEAADHELPVEPPRSKVEQLEAIAATEDPFDPVEDLFGAASLEEILGAVDALVDGRGASVGQQDRGLTSSEESTLADLFGNIANAYAQPFKAFVRELDANHKRDTPTTSDWIAFALPSARLLADATAKMEYAKPAAILARIVTAMAEHESEEGSALPKLFCERILVEHYHLTKLLPATFSLELSDDELAARKEGLIVNFILRQIPEVDQRTLNRIVFAGLGSFDRFMEIPAEEISQVTGIPKEIANTIFMKFYQYRDLFYQHAEPAKHEKLVRLFDISLGILKELHAEIERLNADDRRRAASGTAAKRGLVADRQRTLYGLYTLLCIKGEHDLVERLQLSLFEERIPLLDAYLAQIGDPTAAAIV